MTGDPDYTLLYYPLNIDELLDKGVGDPRWSGSTALHRRGGLRAAFASCSIWWITARRCDAKTKLGWTPLMVARGRVLRECEERISRSCGDPQEGGASEDCHSLS